MHWQHTDREADRCPCLILFPLSCEIEVGNPGRVLSKVGGELPPFPVIRFLSLRLRFFYLRV